MKNQVVITAAVLALTSAANADFQYTTSYSTFQTAAGALGTVSGDLGYVSGNATNGQAGTWGLSFTVQSSTTSLSYATPNTIDVSAPTGAPPLPTFLTFEFPSAATFPVRGFGIYFGNAVGVPYNITLYVNGDEIGQQTITTTASQFLGIYADSLLDDDITSITMSLSVNRGLSITGSAFALVPAPGAVALLGVAGLIGTRRRR